MKVKLGIAFIVFWTPFFASIELLLFHMTWQQVLIARAVAGVFNFGIGCYYTQIKHAFGGARGMLIIKLAVTALAYSTVIICGFSHFHLGKLIAKTLIATTAGFFAGKFGLFDIFYVGFDKVWAGVINQRREVRTHITTERREEVNQGSRACQKITRIREGRFATQISPSHDILTRI